MNTTLRPLLRPTKPPSIFPAPACSSYLCQPCRYARLLRRPKRPYTFTQLVTLSDGSAFTMRTTSPLPVYRSTRDTRNAPLWNPSSKELLNVEDDEAGRLASFRERFGRGFDSNKEAGAGVDTSGRTEPQKEMVNDRDVELDENGFAVEEDANILDLISSYGQGMETEKPTKGKKKGT